LETGLLIGFVLSTLALAFMPGPDNIYVLTESVSRGWRQGIGITCGLISGVLIHTTLVATGLSILVFDYPIIYNILKYAGAAYLLYMAYGAIRESPITISEVEKGLHASFWKLFRKGFVMNVLNPKVTLFFIVLLPQFVTKNGWSPWMQMMILGLIFMIVSFPVFAGIAILAGKMTLLVKSDRFWKITKWIKVIVLIALAGLMVMSDV
jgi:threonine/homoserine/homoserine lactone efflux protein